MHAMAVNDICGHIALSRRAAKIIYSMGFDSIMHQRKILIAKFRESSIAWKKSETNRRLRFVSEQEAVILADGCSDEGDFSILY